MVLHMWTGTHERLSVKSSSLLAAVLTMASAHVLCKPGTARVVRAAPEHHPPLEARKRRLVETVATSRCKIAKNCVPRAIKPDFSNCLTCERLDAQRQKPLGCVVGCWKCCVEMIGKNLLTNPDTHARARTLFPTRWTRRAVAGARG